MRSRRKTIRIILSVSFDDVFVSLPISFLLLLLRVAVVVVSRVAFVVVAVVVVMDVPAITLFLLYNSKKHM